MVLIGVHAQQLVLLALQLHRRPLVLSEPSCLFERKVLVGGRGLTCRAAHRARLVPAAVRGQVGRAAEDLVALGTPVLHAHYAGALVLRKGEGVGVLLFAQLADKLPQRLIPAGARRLLPVPPHLGALLLDAQTQDRGGRDLVLEVQLPVHFGFFRGVAARRLFAVSAAARLEERAFPRRFLAHHGKMREQVHVGRVILVTATVGRRVVAAAAREDPLDGGGHRGRRGADQERQVRQVGYWGGRQTPAREQQLFFSFLALLKKSRANRFNGAAGVGEWRRRRWEEAREVTVGAQSVQLALR